MTRVLAQSLNVLRVWFLALGVLIAGPTPSMAFDDRNTHPRMTESSLHQSGLDANLKMEIGLAQGLNTVLRIGSGRPQTIVDWFRTGATLEDDPACRASNHFHNPLLPFSASAVTDQSILIRAFCFATGFPQALSNVTWGTGFTSPTVKGPATGNPFDWDAARAAYLQALTLPAPTDREAALAQTFQTVGHVMHLVQDLAVPAHVRNDFQSHFEYCDPGLQAFTRWCENSFERFVRLRGELVDNAQPLPIEFNGNRLTRFWDLDRYTGTNPSTDTVQGLAEYTNANFASQYTIFTETAPAGDPHAFPFPRETSTDLPELIAQHKVVRQVTAEDGVLDTGLYVKKIADGEVIDHFLRAGYLTDFAISNLFLRPSLRLTFQMDDVVLGDYAAKLLPRALGYSTGLLDYFFRGKLDVDVVEDMVDPSRLNLVGTNGSPEALKDGSLTVYADDPNGARSLVTSVPVTQVEPNATIPAVPFQAPENTERFVAVYQGTLGQEAKDDSRNLPGAVIGKVLGGVRVEEVFNDGVQWHLRTPQGVFPLPISAEEIVELRWGDRDNSLVGRTRFGRDQLNQFAVYELARPPGFSEIPVVMGPDGSPVVDVKLVKQVPFPLGLDVGTTLDFTQTMNYKQYLFSFVETRTLTAVCDLCPSYQLSSRVISDANIDLMVAQTKSFQRTYSFLLDRSSASCCEGSYFWNVKNFTLSASGQILALVRISLFPQDVLTFPAFTLRVPPGSDVSVLPQPVPVEPVSLSVDLPVQNPLLWAVIDAESGQVIGSTAPAVIQVSFTKDAVVLGPGRSNIAAVKFEKVKFSGGPRNNTSEYTNFGGEVLRKACPENIQPLASLDLQVSAPQLSNAQYRAEIAEVQFPVAVGDFPPVIQDFTYLCPSTDGISASFQVTRRFRNFSVGRVDQAILTNSGGGNPQLVLLLAQSPAVESFFEGGDSARVVTWKPTDNRAELRQEFPAADFYNLESVSSGAALVQAFDFTGFPPTFSTTLVRLEGPAAAVLFPGLRLDNFLLLDPDFLYNTSDFKFYRRQPPLQRTALPAKLAPLSSGFNPVGVYHLLRLQ